MEALRLKKRSEIRDFTDRSSGEKFASTFAEVPGKRQVVRYKSSGISGASGQGSATSQLGTRSLCKRAGTPIKRLLEHEMSKENESKRRSPSIIARLMGLDGLPPQNHGRTRHDSAENYKWSLPSVQRAQRGGTFQDHYTVRKSAREEQEFKDVFEVSDKSKVESNSYSQQRMASSNLTEAEMAFIRQKFMDAKRLSTDEKLQHSKEFYDALEALDSNKDLLLRFLQHPDSLFTKHLHDLQSAVPQMHCSQPPYMKSAHAPKLDSTVPGHKSNREVLQRKYTKSSQKNNAVRPNHRHGRQDRQVAYSTMELPDRDLDEKRALQPTRIVVLKPNVGMTQVGDGWSPSSLSSDDYRADSRLPCTRKRDSELWGKKKALEDVNLSRHDCRESREIAKEITRKMRTNYACVPMNYPTHGFKGYAGDQSSSDLSESDSSIETEVIAVPPRPTRNRKNRHRSSSSLSSESSVSREAKKRLSERWKLTHKSEAVGELCRSSTLAEMLAISDRAGRPANFHGDIFEEGLGIKIEDQPTEWTEPLGISSRDGWKDGCLAKSRSLPASSSATGSARTAMRLDSPCSDQTMIPKEVLKRERSKPMKGNREAFLSSNSRFSVSKSKSSYYTQKGRIATSPEINFGPNQEKRLFHEDLSLEDNLMSTNHHIAVCSESKNVANAGHEKINISPEASHPDLSTPALSNGNVSPDDHNGPKAQEISADQCGEPSHPHIPEVSTPANAKESDQPSPVSILEASFPDDLSSSSECFESLSADLHGLRMQLQLLKLESGGSYEEGPMLVSSDEDGDNEGSMGSTAKTTTVLEAEADWKSLYLVDVLANAKFDDADPDMFMATWHSSECPVGPTVFEELEEKYSNPSSTSRSQRKFLFDCINEELLQIFQQFSDPHPWVTPTTVGPKWDINRLQHTLHKLITKKGERASRKLGEQMLMGQSQWLDLGDEIETIGREIETLLTDELLAEILAV